MNNVSQVLDNSSHHADANGQVLPQSMETHATADHTTAAPDDLLSSPLAGASVLQPVHIYPKGSLALQRLKCPTLRNYCTHGLPGTFSQPLRTGLNRSLALFEGGQEVAMTSCRTLPDFDQARLDETMAAGRMSDTPRYSCAQVRADGATTCPTGGCPLPDGKIADAPIDLLNWDCNIKDVGQSIMASSIVASEFGSELVNVRDDIFVPDNGVYVEVDESELHSKIISHLGPMGTMKQLSEIGKILRITHVRRMNVIVPSPNHICFKNGTFDVATASMVPHDPEHMLLNHIEHDYMPEATCPRFINFLESVWQPDSDRAQKIQFIRQWLGYILVADSSMQKMLILRGEGANGKSVLMEIARHLVGEKNTASAMLDRLRLPYVRATMDRKLLNQSADLPKIGSVADGDMKAIVSGDAIEVAPKFKPSYTIKPYVRLMVATNSLPNSRDTSDGYFRRLIILSFNRQFAEQERNPRLLHSLLEEMSGIVAWAVQGLIELRQQEAFTIPASSTAAVQAYRDDIAPVRMFAEECLMPSNDRSGFAARDIFLAFRAWCRDRGFDAGNMVTLGRELSTLGFSSRKSGNTLWMIKVKESGQEYFRPAQVVAEPIAATVTAQLPAAA